MNIYKVTELGCCDYPITIGYYKTLDLALKKKTDYEKLLNDEYIKACECDECVINYVKHLTKEKREKVQLCPRADLIKHKGRDWICNNYSIDGLYNNESGVFVDTIEVIE